MRTIPLLPLPEITLRAPGMVPPIWLLAAPEMPIPALLLPKMFRPFDIHSDNIALNHIAR